MNDNSFVIYVVEDNEWYNKLLVHNLSLNLDYEIHSFFNAKELLEAINHKAPNVVTIDYRLPDMDGDTLLAKVKEINTSIEAIIISEQEDIKIAVRLLKAGAFDYLVKSKDIKERLLNAISHVRKNSNLKNKIKSLQREVEGKYAFEKSIVGKSTALKKVFNLIAKATETNITVTVTGETGTGKEVVSKAIHYNSSRKKEPFVAVNMAAIPADLIESELFGYEKGAFTGAESRRKGKFEEAGNGTLFLDEIGEMDINFQAKILRALQEREITRIGGNETIKLNCRIIVATNRNLIEDVKEGKFRDDLYYRLFGLPIHLPPLREREKDVLLLSNFFIEKFSNDNNIEVKKLTERAQQKLLSYQWPGNIRELKSVVELGLVMSSSDRIDAADFSLGENDVLPNVLIDEVSLREYNRRIVNHYMSKYDDNTKLIADKLEIGQTTVYRLLKESKVKNK